MKPSDCCQLEELERAYETLRTNALVMTEDYTSALAGADATRQDLEPQPHSRPVEAGTAQIKVGLAWCWFDMHVSMSCYSSGRRWEVSWQLHLGTTQHCRSMECCESAVVIGGAQVCEGSSRGTAPRDGWLV